jgi:hypothetical protein
MRFENFLTTRSSKYDAKTSIFVADARSLLKIDR